MDPRLRELRAKIRAERPFIRVKPYSHNIVRLCLCEIRQKFGLATANKAVRDLELTPLGYNEESE